MLLALMLVGFVSLLAVAVWLAYQNRSSDTLRSNGATALMVGGVGLLATLWFSLKPPEARRHRFTVTFVVDTDTRLPLSRDRYPDLWSYAAPDAAHPAMVDVEPFVQTLAAKTPLSPSDVQAVYLDVLVAYVMDVFARNFASSWDVEIVRDKSVAVTTTKTSPRRPTPPGVKVERTDLVGHLSASKQLLAQILPGWEEFVVPPDTRLEWLEDPWSRVLKASNPFVTVSIDVGRAFGAIYGSGRLGELAGMSREESQKRHMAFSFVMQLDASFERLRSGHPEMPRYTQWVDTIFSDLRAFDAEPVWAKIEQEHALFRGLRDWHQRSNPPERAEP